LTTGSTHLPGAALAPAPEGVPKRLSVAFIGGGFMGQVHSRACRAAGAELVGLASSTPGNAARLADELRAQRSYSSSADVFADDSVDVVHILTPNSTHYGFALSAITAGKHVVCEKPLATSLREAHELQVAADEAGVVATVPFAYRFHPMVREARARVQDGRLGAISSVQGTYLQDWLLTPSDDNWRVDERLGGPSRAFADIGSHLTDMIEFVSGDRISAVQALGRTVLKRRTSKPTVTTEDLVALVFQLSSGGVGTMLVSQVAPGRKNSLTLEISGSAETYSFSQEDPETLWIGRRTRSELLRRNPAELSEDAQRLSVLPAGHPQGVQDAFNAFIADTYAAIQCGEVRDGLPTFADGVRSARITEAVMTSIRTRSWVDVG
jgi:predicted dehydrogenase